MRILLSSSAANVLSRRIQIFSSLWIAPLSQFVSGAEDRVKAQDLLLTKTSQLREFAKAAENKKKDDKTKKKDEVSYWKQKMTAKDRRRELFMARKERRERVKVRRAGKPKGQKRNDFRIFFIKKKVDDEYMNRKARQAGLDWKIHVGVILLRSPLELPDKEEWELEYDQMKGYLNQFGKMYPKELVGNVDYSIVKPMEDYEVTNEPCETEADKSGNVRTTDRKLKTNLYLTVQDSGKEDPWRLPTVELKDDETFVEGVKRAVAEKVGSDVQFWCPSNCPFSVDMEAFSEEKQKAAGCYGIKTFFMRVNYCKGSVSEKEKSVNDFAWLDRDEVVQKVKEQQGEPKSKFYHYML